jgi:hypothetical protein
MPTARMLEAEWRQVLQGSVGTESKEYESRIGPVRAAGFHHVTARSQLVRVLKHTNILFLNFPIHFSGRGELRILN